MPRSSFVYIVFGSFWISVLHFTSSDATLFNCIPRHRHTFPISQSCSVLSLRKPKHCMNVRRGWEVKVHLVVLNRRHCNRFPAPSSFTKTEKHNTKAEVFAPPSHFRNNKVGGFLGCRKLHPTVQTHFYQRTPAGATKNGKDNARKITLWPKADCTYTLLTRFAVWRWNQAYLWAKTMEAGERGWLKLNAEYICPIRNQGTGWEVGTDCEAFFGTGWHGTALRLWGTQCYFCGIMLPRPYHFVCCTSGKSVLVCGFACEARQRKVI